MTPRPPLFTAKYAGVGAFGSRAVPAVSGTANLLRGRTDMLQAVWLVTARGLPQTSLEGGGLNLFSHAARVCEALALRTGIFRRPQPDEGP